MQITTEQLRAALARCAAGQVTTATAEQGATMNELATALQLSHEMTCDYVRQAINNGTLQHVMVWRATIGGYRARTHGYTMHVSGTGDIAEEATIEALS